MAWVLCHSGSRIHWNSDGCKAAYHDCREYDFTYWIDVDNVVVRVRVQNHVAGGGAVGVVFGRNKY